MSIQQPHNLPHHLLCILCDLLVVVHDAQGGEHPGTGWGNYIAISKAHPLHHLGCCFRSTSPQLLVAHIVGNGIALKHTESIVTLKGWKLASRKFTEKFGGAVGLAKIEVGWCGEHTDLSLAVLSGSEGLEDPPVFRYVSKVPAAMVILQRKGLIYCCITM